MVVRFLLRKKKVRTVDGKTVRIDCDIAPLVQALNDAGIKTTSSCSGHGEDGYILTDDYVLIVSKERGKAAFSRYLRDFNDKAARDNIKREYECKK